MITIPAGFSDRFQSGQADPVTIHINNLNHDFTNDLRRSLPADTLLLFRMLPLPQIAISQAWLVKLHHPRTGVPYGIAMAAAALLVYPSTPWFLNVVS